MSAETIKILMVDDNKDDFIIVRKMLSSVKHGRFHVDWVPDCEKGLEQAKKNEHDLCLVDYRLGPKTGLEFFKEAVQEGCATTFILLTGQADYSVDVEAMQLGAADFINKNNLEPNLLERTIRYAIERKKSQETLLRREEFFREVIENSQDGIAIIHARGFRYLSPSLKMILGYSAHEMIQKNEEELIHPDDLSRVKKMFEETLKISDLVQGIHFRVKHSDGTWRLLECVAKNSINVKSIQGLVVHFRDVTHQKEAERTAARLATIVESSDDAIYSVSLDGIILSWNPGAERIYGFTPDEIGGRDMALIVPPERKDEFPRLLTTVRQGEAVANFFTTHRAKNGKEVLLSLTVSPIRNTLAQVVRASVIARDITESEKAKSAKEILQVEKDLLLNRLQLQMERMPIGCFLTDHQYRITYLNPAAEKTFGYSFRDLEGKNPVDKIVALSARSFVEEFFLKLSRREQVLDEAVVSENLHKNGKVIICEWYHAPFHDSNGNFMGIMCMVLDITERRKAEGVQSQLAAILQQAAVAIVGLDLEGNVTNWNQGAENLFGYGFDEIEGQSALCLILPEEMDTIRDLWKKTIELEQVLNREETWVKKNGNPIPVSITLTPIRNEIKKIIGISIIARDITFRKQVQATLQKQEEQTRLAQKMDAIGRLAGGVAHDFNNLLSVIGGNVEFLMDDPERDNSQKEELLEVQKAVRQGAELTKQLLVFGQKQVSQPQPVNLSEISVEMNKMLKRLIDASIDFHIVQGKELKLIQADPGQIQQVILNLVINARDAMPKGGRLRIETKNIGMSELEDKKENGLPGTYVELTVLDTGMGMTPEVQKHIFEPFFTTKEGKGTGLGLTTVYAIVKKWNGSIYVNSTPGEGTSFRLLFPALDHVSEIKSKPRQETLIPMGSETILVAEDEEPVRKILVRVLEKYGYKVLQTQHGMEALQKSLDYKEKIDLLLTDTIMPKMNGKELADLIKNSRPQIKIIFISGYTQEILSQQGILDLDIHLIQKPFELDFLVRQVRKVLDEK